MEPRPLQFFAHASRGVLRGILPGQPVLRIGSDSRETRAGDLFVAIPGDHFDGHDYVLRAVERGAVACVVAESQAHRFPDAPLLIVDDPRRALGRMAAHYRADFRVPVVAVAGSNGKTSTKDLVATILGTCFETLRSPESFNNDIGLPATLFGLESRHLAAVVELGTNHPGELAPLVRIAQPRIGVLTHIGEEHLEFFGSLAGVIEEEGWIADLLPPNGMLVLPGDAPWTEAIVRRTRAQVVRAGRSALCDWRLLESQCDAGGTTFTLRAPSPEWSGEYRINLLGGHQVSNALLAIATAAQFGLGRREIQRGLSQCQPAKWRMNHWQWEGVDVLEDCYNANLDSTVAAIDTLRDFPCAGRRIAVVGSLAELGIHTPRAHTAIGHHAARAGIDRVVAIGETAVLSAEAASEAGRTEGLAVDSIEAAAAQLRSWLRPGDCILIKGSRSARLERLGALLRDAAPCLQHAA